MPIPSERHVPRPGLLDDVRGLLVPGAGRGPTLVGLVGMGGVGKKEMRSARDRALIGPSDFVSISKRRAGKGYTK